MDGLLNHKELVLFVFDMDGTLYKFDSENGGYAGSSLESIVLENATSYIRRVEGCSIEKAMTIRELGIKDPIGLSAFLADRYDTTRKAYFDVVWNIDPSLVIKQFEIPLMAIKHLSSIGKTLYLVTSAPVTWQRNVFSFLDISRYFKEIYTAEDFSSNKGAVFGHILKSFDPAKTISIGDQQSTDLLPAAALGMQTFLVKNPGDLHIFTQI